MKPINHADVAQSVAQCLGKTKTALFNHSISPQNSFKKQHYAGVAQR